MKVKKALLSCISISSAIIIAILAFVRGKEQTELLIASLSAWAAWAAVLLLIAILFIYGVLYMLPAARRSKLQKQRLNQQKLLSACHNPNQVSFEIPLLKKPSLDQLLLRHVNHRISMYLRSARGENITWEWCHNNPLELITEGGTGRIRLFGCSDFDHADVKLSTNADIHFDMMHVVPMEESQKKASLGETVPPSKQPVDPQIWYEMQARSTLESLVADLSSRGHSSLMVSENGEISVEQDQEQVITEHLPNFPAIHYWPRLVQVLAGEGLTAEVEDRKIIVSW